MRGVTYWLNIELPSGRSTYRGVTMQQAELLTAVALRTHYPDYRYKVSRHVLYNLLHGDKRRANKTLARIVSMQRHVV